jgi:hypothetical protein
MTRGVAAFLVGVVLILGTCFLDGNGQAAPDLCLALLAVAHGPEVDCPLALVGTLVPALNHGAPLVLLDRPVPPPRA